MATAVSLIKYVARFSRIFLTANLILLQLHAPQNAEQQNAKR
jgi:hypothetical protein